MSMETNHALNGDGPSRLQSPRLVAAVAELGSLKIGMASRPCLWRWLTPVWLVALAAHAADGRTPPSKLEFNRDIRPILSENCFRCHGPDKNQRKAKLRLDVREVALEKEAFVPGKPDESEL